MVALIQYPKRAEERAESGMLGVIQGADIGNHEVSEKKVIGESK